MKDYILEVVETKRYYIDIKAENEDEAKDQFNSKYRSYLIDECIDYINFEIVDVIEDKKI